MDESLRQLCRSREEVCRQTVHLSTSFQRWAGTWSVAIATSRESFARFLDVGRSFPNFIGCLHSHTRKVSNILTEHVYSLASKASPVSGFSVRKRARNFGCPADCGRVSSLIYCNRSYLPLRPFQQLEIPWHHASESLAFWSSVVFCGWVRLAGWPKRTS